MESTSEVPKADGDQVKAVSFWFAIVGVVGL